jgi:8-hydroxy-5-deazaflavin:NADPH oxidoreductase
VKIAFLGSGNVGAPLAEHLARQGHEVTLAGGSAGSASVARALARHASLRAAPAAQAIEGADVVFLATPYAANEAVLAPLAPRLEGKILVDCTNPIGPGLSHGLGSVESGSARVQALVPGAHVVKAFTIYGFENFEDSAYPGYSASPAMLFCGDDAASKLTVATLITELGWEPVDVGGLEQALHLEHMTLLWVRMVRVHGKSPNLVWAALRRS